MNYQQKYLKYKSKYLKLKSQKKQIFKNLSGGSNLNTLYLFKAEWCGHCKNFKNTWNELKNTLGNEINLVAYDADKDAETIKNYNIDGYPTLILKSNNKAIEYVGSRDLDSIKNFINEYTKTKN
jgi:protein disulfide-isomerase A6